MNICKIKISNEYAFMHVDRTYNKDHEYHGRSYIDDSRSYLNFNLSNNNRHRKEQLSYIEENTKKNTRKNATIGFSCIITLPRKYKEACEENPELMRKFFQDAKDSMVEFFGLTEDDVASAWVHLDETTPHMHLILTPLYREEDKTILYFDRVVPRAKYVNFHGFVEENMKKLGWKDLDLQNGEIKPFKRQEDFKKAMKEKRLLELDQDIITKKQELEDINEEIKNLSNYAAKTKEDIKKDTEQPVVKKDIVTNIIIRLFKREWKTILELLSKNIEKLKPESQNEVKQLISLKEKGKANDYQNTRG